MKGDLNLKDLKMGKGQQSTLVVVAIATVITVFCLVSAKALWSQAAYHRHVISAKHDAVKQLQANIDSVNTLKTQYDTFNSINPNVIGGNNVASVQDPIPPDGNNSRI